MKDQSEPRVTLGLRLVAALLLFGAIVGIVSAGHFLLQLARGQTSGRVGTTVIFLILDGMAGWIGWGLLRGCQEALTRAKIFFLIQVPLWSVAGFAYEFSIGLSFRLMVSWDPRLAEQLQPSRALTAGANVGSSFTLDFHNGSPTSLAGINLLALLILIYLGWATRSGRQDAAPIATASSLP